MTSIRSWLFVSLMTISFQAFAQTEAINGSIRGRATDPSGTAVPAAAVTVNNVDTGYTRDVQTNDEGYFVIPNLPIEHLHGRRSGKMVLRRNAIPV